MQPSQSPCYHKEDLQLTGEWDLKFLQVAQDFGDISDSPLLTFETKEATPMSSVKSSSKQTSSLKKKVFKNRPSEEKATIDLKSPLRTSGTPSTPFKKQVVFENTECSTPLSNAMLEEKFSAVEKERLIAYRRKLESSERELKKVKNNLADEQKASSQYQSTIESLRARIQELEKRSVQPFSCNNEQIKNSPQLSVESPHRLQIGFEPDTHHYQTQDASDWIQKLSLKEQQCKESMEYCHELDAQVKTLREENERLRDHLEYSSKQKQEQIDELANLCEQASNENDHLIEEITALQSKLEEKEKNERELHNQLNILKEKVERSSHQEHDSQQIKSQLKQDNMELKKQLEEVSERLEQTLKEIEELRLEKQNREEYESNWKQNLEEENWNLKNQIQNIQQTWETKQKADECNKQQREEYIEQLMEEKQKIQSELTEKEEKYQVLRENQSNLEENIRSMKQEIDSLKQSEHKLNEKWESVVHENRMLKTKLEESQNNYESLQEEYKKLLDIIEQKEESYETTRKELESRVVTLGNELDASKQGLSLLNKEVQLKNDQIDTLKQKLEQISEDRKELQTQLQREGEEREQLQRILNEKQNEIDQFQSRYEELLEEFNKTRVSHESEDNSERLEDRVEELSLQVADLTEQLKRLDEENGRLIAGDSQTKHKIQFVAKLKEENRQLRNQYLELQSRMRELQRKLAPTPAKPKYHLPKSSKCSEEENRNGTKKKEPSQSDSKKETCQDTMKPSHKEHPYLTRSRVPNLDKENEQSNL